MRFTTIEVYIPLYSRGDLDRDLAASRREALTSLLSICERIGNGFTSGAVARTDIQ